MVVHSEDDNVVPTDYGYDVYYDKYKDDSRFVFIRLEDKVHNYVYNDTSYINEFNAEFDKWLETLDYDYKVQENNDRFKTDKAEYIHNSFDREKWCNTLDKDMFESFLKFYDEKIQ